MTIHDAGGPPDLSAEVLREALAEGALAEGALAEEALLGEGALPDQLPGSPADALPAAQLRALLRDPALRCLLGDVAIAEVAIAEVAVAEVAVAEVELAERNLAEEGAAQGLSADVRAAALVAFEASLASAPACPEEAAIPEALEAASAARTGSASEREPLQAVLQEAVLQEAVLQEVRLDVSAASEDAANESLSPAVRSAALAAFARTSLAREPLKAHALRPLMGPRSWVATAALLLVFIGAGLFLSGGEHEAEAGLQLSSLARVDRAGSMLMSQVQPRYFAAMGSRFAPGEDELVAFGFGPDARLIVGSGDAVRVTDASAMRAAMGGDVGTRDVAAGQRPLEAGLKGSAFMRLESGEVLLVTRSRAVPLLVGSAGLFVLLDGAAHVAVYSPGGLASGVSTVSQDSWGGSEIAVALPRGSRARFYARDGSRVDLMGPATGLLSAAGPRTFGEEARSLFEELKFFGGPLPRAVREAPVSARVCGVRSGRVRQGRQALQILGSERASTRRSQAGSEVATIDATFTWRPRPWLAHAHLLRVHLRAPAGTRLSLPLVGADGAASTAEVQGAHASGGTTLTGTSPSDTSPSGTTLTGTMGAEPGIPVLEIPLAPGWYERLQGQPLLIEVRVPAPVGQEDPRARLRALPQEGPGRGVVAWFDGLTLVLAARQPEAPGPMSRAHGTGLHEQGGARDD